jgi:hypothetical protein
MTETPVTREALELAFRDYLAESRRERASQFSPDMLAWLALPPQWTARLARQAGFPGWDPAFLEAATKEGLCARTPTPLAGRPPWYAAEVRARLAAYLPAGSLTGLLDEVAAIGDQHAQARILATMTHALPRPLLTRATEIANRLDDPAARTRALLATSAAQPPAEAAVTAGLAFDVAARMEDPGDRAETLLQVAEQGRLADGVRQELGRAILATLPELAYESERSSILVRAAPYLTPQQVEQALAAALALRAAQYRIEALAGVTAQLPDAQAVPLLRDEIPAIETISTGIGRDRAAKTLARRLADCGAADLATSTALTLTDEAAQETALQAVAGSLASAGDPGQAAEAATPVMAYGQDSPDEVAFLSSLANRLASGDRSTAIGMAERARQAAATLASTPANARALVSLVTALINTGLEAGQAAERALQATARISGPKDRYQLYRRLLPALPDPLRGRAVEQALAAAQGIASPPDRIDALVDLAPYLPPGQLETVIQAIQSLAARETDFSFWTPEPARTEVLGELALRYGPTFLHTQAARVAEGVLAADRPDDPVSPAMARWAELARHGAVEPAQAANWLDRRLADLIEDGDSDQALAWIETGKLLVPVLGRELDSVVAVGLRRIELLYRRTLDLGHLRRFLPRPEQIEEFWRLLDGDGTIWAVHYLGAGGLGKTMLMRQVAARLAPERGIPTARVDFDHLSPEYPIAKPGQLLLELLDELQSFSANAQADSFAYSFRAQVAQLHAAVTPGSNDPLARIHDEQFGEVLRTFCDFVRLLPQPVVLILDTCEELARRQAEGSTLPPVEATFEILERLHEEVPWLRVMFAGRRLLARSGPGWSVSPAAGAEGHGLLPERKDFLALHEMRGFSRDEVTGYLAGAAPGLSAGMTEAILARSLAPASAAPVVWEPPRPRDAEPRYNPFDVNLYASWALEDPSLRAETIAQGTTDPYIAIRIVRRLGQTDLARLLPAVTLLGRFDRSMLRGELPGSDERFERAYHELSSQEWIAYQPDPSLNTTFLELDRNLRPRLLSYYRNDPDRYFVLSQARDRLGPALGHLVEDRSLNEIGVDLIDAAMRLLPPADAARLWDTAAGQIRAQGDWAWAGQRTSRLLGEDGAVADPGHPARAAVLASRISALIHTRPEYNPAPDWREVGARAAASPDPAVREWLRCCAVAGLVAAFRLRGVELSADDLAAFWELVDQFAVVSGRLPGPLAEQLAASCCAALEALVEVAEMRGDPSLVSDIPLIERWLGDIASRVPADLLALGTMIAARGLALHGRFEAALELAARAEESSADRPASPPGRWADFDAPSMASDRIRLELVRMAVTLPVPADLFQRAPLADWQRSAEENLGTIDADRLLAAILLRRLAAGILSRDGVARLAALEEQATERVRRSPRSALWCHRAVPPLFTAVAWGWTALGQSDRALELLNARRRRALAAGDDDAENAALTATLEISRRMRITQPVLAKDSAGSADPGQQAAAWALTALTESPGAHAAEPVSQISDACLHDWWRTRPVPLGANAEDARLFRRRAEQVVAHRGDLTPFAAFSLGLDLAEADIAAARTPDWQASDYDTFEASAQVTAEQVVRVRLRAQALGHPDFQSSFSAPAESTPAWMWRVGLRRAAELALDEGELLALRLPRLAVTLLDQAGSLLNGMGDWAGALFAAIAAALARQRAGMAIPPDRVYFLSGVYEAVARQPGASLPAWADLARQRVFLEPRRLEPTMGGWLPRLAACLARRTEADGAARKPVGDTQVRNMLEARLGSVPAELDPSVLTRRQLGWPWRARRRTPHSRWWWFFRITLGVFGVASAVVTVLAVLNLFRPSHLNTGTQSTDLNATIQIGLVALLIAVGGVPVALIAWTLVRRRARRWAKAVVGLRITPSSGHGAADGEIGIDIEKWQADPPRLPPWKHPEPAHVTDSAVLPPLRAYERSAAALPASLQDGFRELARLVGSRRSVRISLDIDPALERMPWEALLSYPLLTAESALPGALDFWRRGEPLAGTGRPRRAQPPGTVAVLADTTRRLFAERAGLGRSVSFPDLSGDDVNRAIERAGALATDPPDIVLVIGRPVRVRDAVLLQTAEQAAARGTSEDDLRESVVGGGLLEPQVVAGLAARLFIVLGAPGETAGRFDTERRDTADLRGWAADVFRAGAATVIMLPSMKPERAEAVLGKIASCIRKGITPDAVYEAVRAARLSTGTPAQRGAADRPVEQALDISLFRRDYTPAFTVFREQER